MVWDIDVTVARQRVCSCSKGIFPLRPVDLWQLLACQESRPVFRVEDRKQLSCSNGKIVERVVFVAPVRIVFWKKWAQTEVHQTVDMSDPSNVRVDFSLVHSDMMLHLTGSWQFELLEQPSSVSLGRTKVTYCFEMWPKGVPTALRFMPGLLDAVKGAVAREAAQLLDKLAFVASKVRPGMCLLAAAREASAEVEAAGGSFKCLQLEQSGSKAEAAAAAAAEAAARQQLRFQHRSHHQQQLLQQQQRVVCHALDDVSSESEDDCLVALGSSSSITSSSCMSCSLTADDSSCCCLSSLGSLSASSASLRVSSSSGGCSSGSSTRSTKSDGGRSVDVLVTALSASSLR